MQGEINWMEELHENTHNESARNETNVTSWLNITNRARAFLSWEFITAAVRIQ